MNAAENFHDCCQPFCALIVNFFSSSLRSLFPSSRLSPAVSKKRTRGDHQKVPEREKEGFTRKSSTQSAVGPPAGRCHRKPKPLPQRIHFLSHSTTFKAFILILARYNTHRRLKGYTPTVQSVDYLRFAPREKETRSCISRHSHIREYH